TVTLRNNQTTTLVAATVSVDATGQVIQLIPTAALAGSTTYCYSVVAGVLGTNGKAATTFSACFTTGTSLQTTAPTVVAVSPADQVTNVPVNANVRVVFSGAIDPLTVTGSTLQISGGAAVLGSISFSNGNTTVQVTPQGLLPASSALTLTMAGVTDLAGNL